MNIGIIGLGIIGSACKFGFEKLGHKLSIHDTKLNTDIKDVLDSEIIYVCVPTPSNEDGSCNTSIVEEVIYELKSNNYLICRGTHKLKPFPYDKAWIDQTGNFDYVDTISKLIFQLIQSDSTGVFNIGTHVKSMFELASQTTPVEVAFRTPEVPRNTTMNLNKLNNALKGTNK